MWIRLASFIRSHHTALSEQLAHSEAVCEPTCGLRTNLRRRRDIHIPARVLPAPLSCLSLCQTKSSDPLPYLNGHQEVPSV